MRSAFLFVVSFALACPVVRADDGLIAAAKARTDKFPAVDITYSMAETIRKGTRLSEIPGKDTFPPRDEACRSENRLVFSKQCVRLELNHPLWDVSHNKLSKSQSISATNGQSSKMFHPNGIGEGEKPPKGYIEPSGKMADCASIILIPLTLYFRGADSAVSPLKLEEFRKSGATIPTPKGPLTVYESPLGSSSMELWCDDRTGFVHRFRITTKRKVTEQIDIVYGERPSLGTVPVKWVTDRYERDGSGVLKDTTVSEILAIQSAAEFDPSLFVITFPPGTEVFDQRTNQDMFVSQSGRLVALTEPRTSSYWWGWAVAISITLLAAALAYRIRTIRGHQALKPLG